MLRLPPSVIGLTSTDIQAFEHRLAVRQSAQHIDLGTGHFRLSQGPSREARLGIVSVDSNTGRKRVASSSSQETVCTAEEVGFPVTFVSDSSGAWVVDAPTDVHSMPRDQLSLCFEAANALDRFVARGALRRRDSLERLDCTEVSTLFTEDTSMHFSPTLPTVDGSTEQQGTVNACDYSPVHNWSDHRHILEVTSRRDHTEIMSSPPAWRPFSSDLARRRHRNSNEQQSRVMRGHEAQHLSRYDSVFLNFSHPSGRGGTPELVVPQEDLPGPSLDPDAPVFIPRTRFGTLTGSTSGDEMTQLLLEPRWESLHSAPSITNLRIRSSAEQNVEPPNRSLAVPSVYLHSVQRRSRASNQNAVIAPSVSLNVQHYPLLQALSQSAVHRRGSAPHQAIAGASHNTSSALPASTLRASSGGNDRNEIRHRRPLVDDGVDDEGEFASAASPAVMIESHTTASSAREPPDPSRNTSLAERDGVTVAQRPRMGNAVSGVSATLSNRNASAQGLDAASEFLRMRNSPQAEQ